MTRYILGPGVWCGTIGGYTNHKCRCDKCKKAWRTHARRYAVRTQAKAERQRRGRDEAAS